VIASVEHRLTPAAKELALWQGPMRVMPWMILQLLDSELATNSMTVKPILFFALSFCAMQF
jgi:hypothetical protein